MGGFEAPYDRARDRRCVGHTDGTVTNFVFLGLSKRRLRFPPSPLILFSSSLRNRSGTEAIYWKNTNVVRRNLLMAAVRRSIWMEWNPMGEAYVDNQSLAELRALAFRRLTETVVSFKTSRGICQLTGTRISGQPYQIQPDASTLTSRITLVH